MIGTDTLDRVIGADVYDADGTKIGTASEVFLDDQSGDPEWVTVKTGLLGTKETQQQANERKQSLQRLRKQSTTPSKGLVKGEPMLDYLLGGGG